MKNLIEDLSNKTGLTKLEVTALAFILFSIITGVVLHFAGVGSDTKEIAPKESSTWDQLQKEKEKLKKEKEKENDKDTTKKSKTKKVKSQPYQVNINTGTIADFEQLPGISQKVAEEIVSFRSINGPFKSIDQLDLVKGIGPATLTKLKQWLTL